MARLSQCFLLIIMALLMQGCASGSFVVTGDRKPAIEASQVTVFYESPSFTHEVIGTVMASSDNAFTEASRKQKALNELKQQAAEIGANGVILDKVTESSFKRLSTGVGLSGSSDGGIGTSIGSSFSFPTTLVTGQAIYFQQVSSIK